MKSTIILFLIILALIAGYFFFIRRKDTIKETLIVGTSADYPPFEFIKDGEIVGFDIDLIKALNIKKKILIKEMEFSALFPALNSNKVDIVIAGLSYNKERNQNISFSTAYYSSSFSVIIKRELNINSLSNFSKNFKIGVQTGSTMERFINKLNDSNNTDINIISISSNFILIEKLNLGEIDAMIVEKAQTSSFIENFSKLKYFLIKEDILNNTGQNYVIGFKKDSKLVELINKRINELNTSGDMDKLLKKWNLR